MDTIGIRCCLHWIVKSRCLSRRLGVSMDILLSTSHDRPKIASRGPISATSASRANHLSSDASFGFMEIVVLITYLPSLMRLPSPCSILIFLARFHTPKRLATLGPIMGTDVPQSTIALTTIPLILTGTVSNNSCLDIRPIGTLIA